MKFKKILIICIGESSLILEDIRELGRGKKQAREGNYSEAGGFHE